MVEVQGSMPESWEEHTEIVPRVVVARRRRATVFLVIALVALAIAGGTFLVPHEHQVTQATRNLIAAAGQQLGVQLHATLKQTVDRAEGFAGTPVLEAGILTDAATVADIVKTEYRLKTRPGETLELFQLRTDESGTTQITTLVRVPPDAPPITLPRPNRTRIANRSGLSVVVSAEVAPYNNTTALGGELAVAASVDLGPLDLSKFAVEANLVGDGPPIPLIAKRGGGADPITIPVPLDEKWQIAPLSLHAVPVLTPHLASWVIPTRYGALGLGIAFLCTFFVALRRALRP